VLADQQSTLRDEQLLGIRATLGDADWAQRIAAEALEVHRRTRMQAKAAIGIGALVDEDPRTSIDLLAKDNPRRGVFGASRASLRQFGRGRARRRSAVGSRLGRGACSRSNLKAS